MIENTTQNTTTDAEAATMVEHLDPSTLLVDRNVRHDDRLDPDFLASIASLGVLVPIVGVRTPEGQVRVRFGHRRTSAAVAGALSTVPVVVVADETHDDAATVERLVTQHAENTHRAGLTGAEQADVVAQLSLLGVSAHQIAKRTRIKRDQVDAAITVAGSQAATTALAAYNLDLVQAAALAEFEDDDTTLTALVEAAQRGPGAFNHAAQRARDDRARDQALSRFTADLITARHPLADADTGLPLDRLLDANGERITVEAHTTCPGHAVRADTHRGYLDPATGLPPVDEANADGDDQAENSEQDENDEQDEDEEWAGDDEPADLVWGEYPTAVWVCTDPDAHGHRDRWTTSTSGYRGARQKIADMDPKAAAAARAARADVIESNKAWKAADPVRRDWLRALLTRKTAPANTAAFLATALTTARYVISGHQVGEVAADLFGTTSGYAQPDPIEAMIDKASTKRCEVITLGLVLAAHEANLNPNSWRRVDPTTARYLRFLDECGYDRSNVERRATGDDPLPAPGDETVASAEQ